MKYSEQIILDYYLHGYQKFSAFFLLFISFFGCLNFLFSPTDFIELFFGFLLLPSSYILFVAVIGKKGLYISDDTFYRGIAIGDKFLLKEKVNITKYSEFTHKRKVKTDLPLLFEYSGLGMFSNHHECSVYLTKPNSKKRKILISFSDFELYYHVRRFLKRCTELQEQKA